MKTAIAVAVALVFVAASTIHAQSTAACSTPSILRISMRGNDLYYQLDQAEAHKLFRLGEVSQAVHSCQTEKMLFVIANPEVPIKSVMLPGKEQITKMRYFVQYRTGEVQEVSFGLAYSKIPLAPDIKGYPAYVDTPPTRIPK